MVTESRSMVAEPGVAFPLGAIEAGPHLFEGYRRVALDIDRAAWTRLHGEDVFEPGGVHALRIATKRLRAFWQLQKPTANAALAKGAIRRLRDASRKLAGLRDEYVLRSLLDELSATVVGPLRREFERAAGLLNDLGAPLGPETRQAFLEAVGSDLEDWSRAGALDDGELLDVGLRRAFVKTRDLGGVALDAGAAEDMHRWRRWVKHLRYQIEPLASPERERLAAFYAELKLLGSTLGKLNDLANLRRLALASDNGGVSSAIERRDKELLSGLPALSDTLLGSSSDDFLAAVKADLGV